MPSTLAPAAAPPEPTLRDILDAVNGLGTEVAELKTRFDGLEVRFGRLEARIDGLEAEVGYLRTEVAALTALSQEKFAHFTREIAAVRADNEQASQQIEALDRRTSEMHAEVAKIDQAAQDTVVMHSKVDVLLDTVSRIEPQVAETLKLGQDNRRLGQELQEELARLDRKLDRHLGDDEIHLPRPRSMDLPEAGPIAA